jgi:hypothetical protein
LLVLGGTAAISSCSPGHEAAPGETAQSLEYRCKVATTALSWSVLQSALGATNEKRSHRYDEQRNGHEEVGKRNREPIRKANPATP